MDDDTDPVKIELRKLEQALLGNRQNTLESLAESEKLARVARDSRPGMKAVRPVVMDPQITAKFRALRGQR